jgi:hypothetical protein
MGAWAGIAIDGSERPLRVGLTHSTYDWRTAGYGVRREKAALSSGCKAHPAIRSSRKQSEQSWTKVSRVPPAQNLFARRDCLP